MSGGSQSSRAESRSGLMGSPYESSGQHALYQANRRASDVYTDIAKNPMLFEGKTGAELFPSGQYGLGYNVDPAVANFGKQLYSLASSGGAARGRLTPEGAEAAAGDAIAMALPSLIPSMMQFGQYQFNLPMGLNQYRANLASQGVQTAAGALGQRATSASKGFDVGFLTGSGGGAATSAGLAAMGYSASDQRLKSNIVYLRQHPLGVGIYEYTINGNRERGVMAQELLDVVPEAVAIGPDGYYMVNYDRIGGRPL